MSCAAPGVRWRWHSSWPRPRVRTGSPPPRRLVEEFPATLAALRAGDIDWRRAKLITEVADRVGLEAAHRVETRVLPKAGQRTLAQHRRAVERAILAVDPAGAEQRHTRAAAGRRVAFYPLEDGMGQLTAELTADGLAAVRAVLDAAAATMSQCHGEARSMDQLRADALVEMASAALSTGWLGGPTGRGLRLRHRAGTPTAHPRHRPLLHPDRPRRPPRRADRLRPHPRLDRAADRRRRGVRRRCSPTPPPAPCSTTDGPPTSPRPTYATT